MACGYKRDKVLKESRTDASNQIGWLDMRQTAENYTPGFFKRTVTRKLAAGMLSQSISLWLCFAVLLSAGLLRGSQVARQCGDRYVDGNNKASSNAGPGTKAHPWKSLAAVNAHHFCPGDTVYFARGSEYEGGFVVRDSGEPGRPITFTAYGPGPAPRFTNPDFKVLNGNVIQIRGSYIVVDGLSFSGGAPSATTRNRDVLAMGDVFIARGANHGIVRNSEFRNSPIGIHVCGRFNLITHNYLHDTNRFLAGKKWGPIAIFVSNGNNEISYNRITNYIAIGGRFGADGGAIELDPRIYGASIHDVRIDHNYSRGNEGFIESTRASEPTTRLSIAYNVSDDYQEFILLWQGTHCMIANNTVLRVLPRNSVTDVVFAFGQDGNVVRNNIFVVNGGRKVFSANGTQVWGFGGDYSGQEHDHNLYYSVDHSQANPLGLRLGPGGRIANPHFADYGRLDLHLKANSPAIDAGVPVAGYRKDFTGNPVPSGKAPDMGAFEFQH